MEEKKYIVEMDGMIVARDMSLNDAAILIKGLAEEYYNEMAYGGKITLMEESRTEINNSDE